MSSDIERSESPLPRKRASSSARQFAADALASALADGQLDFSEFDARSSQVWKITFADELERLTADLDVTNAPQSTGDPAPGQQQASRNIVSQPGGSSVSFALMGGSVHEGSWHIARHHTSFALMGGTYLDLRCAKLSAQETVIDAISIMGGIKIVVPEDVRVVSDGLGIMGGFGIKDHPSCTMLIDDVPAFAPLIRLRGIGLMGGVSVVRASRNAPAD